MEPTSASNDPWTPMPQQIARPSSENIPQNDFVLGAPSYVASLENKLARLKKRSQNPSSKDMIRCLASAKECQLKGMMTDAVSPYISNHDYENESTDTPGALAALQRRLRPEQAMTEEELRTLLDNDELAKQIAALLDCSVEDSTRPAPASHEQSPDAPSQHQATSTSPPAEAIAADSEDIHGDQLPKAGHKENTTQENQGDS